MQYLGYTRLLTPALVGRELDVANRRRALKRWLVFAVAWQTLVIAAVLVYGFAMTRGHRSGLTWIAPPLAALLGTALPYQLVVGRLVRAAR